MPNACPCGDLFRSGSGPHQALARPSYSADNSRMGIIFLTLAIVLTVAAFIAVVLAMVVVGIHSEDRCMNLGREPRTLSERIARRITGAYVSRPREMRRARVPSGK